MTEPLDPIAAATLLRELAVEIRTAEGVARNGLFLELHRLHDTIFRLSLESHPDLPPELQGTAFNLEEAMPAPQVVRELNRLGSPLASKEIRNLYKHMNMARNNMAHDSLIGRVTISNSNMKRMVELATLVAGVLDPTAQGISAAVATQTRAPIITRARAYALIGVLCGVALAWGWWLSTNPFVAVGVTVVVLGLLVAAWIFGD